MPTLDELKQANNDKALADYYYVYNEEYNALLTTKENADAALFAEKHGAGGVNMPQVLQLQSMILGLQSRIAKLDEKMLAFHQSTLAITPPDQGTIDNVTKLADEVAHTQVKDGVIDTIVGTLQKIASLTTAIQGA